LFLGLDGAPGVAGLRGPPGQPGVYLIFLINREYYLIIFKIRMYYFAMILK